MSDNYYTMSDVKAAKKSDGSITAKVYVPAGKHQYSYANPVEYGHIVRTNHGYKYVAAQPFMGPAREAKKTEVLAKIRDILKGALR